MFDCLSDFGVTFLKFGKFFIMVLFDAKFTQVDPKSEMEIVFLFLRY